MRTVRFRIATYNVHKCRGLDGRVRPDRIARVLKEVDADVVALQEVLSIHRGPPEAHQAEYLAGALGLNLRIGITRTLRERRRPRAARLPAGGRAPVA